MNSEQRQMEQRIEQLERDLARMPVRWPLQPSESADSNCDDCDCCVCCATLWYVVDDEIAWSADFFEGTSEYDLEHIGFSPTDPGVWPWANACDVDSNGYVYQCGRRSAKLETSLSKPQQPMYSLRSYNSDGTLRWSWGQYPYGYVSGSVRDTDEGLALVRCGGAYAFTSQYIIGTDDFIVRKHHPDTGVPIWETNLRDVYDVVHPVNILVGAGPTRLVLKADPAIELFCMVITDHDGTFIFGDSGGLAGVPVWVDDNDSTYLLNLDSSGVSNGAFLSGDAVMVVDLNGSIVTVTVITDGFEPTRLRVYGDQLLASDGSELRLYTIGGTGTATATVTTSEKAMVLTGVTAGGKNEFSTRLRSASTLAARAAFMPKSIASLGDDYLFTDAMPTATGTVWCGRRRCGVTIVPEEDTPTTTSTTTPSTTGTSSTTAAPTTTETSTTTAAPTTTETSSTTSACSGDCQYLGNGTGTGSPTGFYWGNTGNTCTEACVACNTNVEDLATLIGRWPVDAVDSATLPCV
jgi:hypothetical protein